MPDQQNQQSREAHARDRQEQHDATRRDASIERPDVPAQDLPDGGRDAIDTDPSKQSFARDNPSHTGGQVGGEGGLRNQRGMDDADRHGGRKRN